MVNVAIVGYKLLQNSRLERDIVTWLPGELEGIKGLHLCHLDIVEERSKKTIGEIVGELLKSKPDVLHYTNYRDPYNNEKVDQEYVEEVIKQRCDLPILITSAHPDAETFAKQLGIHYLYTPFDINNYINKINELAQKNKL